MTKVHIHSEQFDGWLHAECGAGDWQPPNPRCVSEDDFEKVPRPMRCIACDRYWWPNGDDQP